MEDATKNQAHGFMFICNSIAPCPYKPKSKAELAGRVCTLLIDGVDSTDRPKVCPFNGEAVRWVEENEGPADWD